MALTITVALGSAGDGVLVAQGGKLHGFSLFVQHGTPVFAVRRDGKLHALTALQRLPESEAQLTAVVKPGGAAQLFVNGAIAAESETGMVSKQPAQGLSIGSDSEDPSGDYESPFASTANIKSVVLQFGTAPTAPTAAQSAD
jgi:hypothetical protein